jgi:arylformamidase
MIYGHVRLGLRGTMPTIDVSMPLFVGMPGFPGDPEFAGTPTHSIAKGDAYNVSRLTLRSHAGTHVDPPRHFLPGGAATDQLDLDVLAGPCQLVELPAATAGIGATEVREVPDGTSRVLFRTANSGRWHRELKFFPDYVALTLDGARALLGRGVRLVGIDSLSVEHDPTGTYPVHHTLLGNGVLILEGLLLHDVARGPYSLDCLPLRWRGGDGGPARAVLRST